MHKYTKIRGPYFVRFSGSEIYDFRVLKLQNKGPPLEMKISRQNLHSDV